LSNVVDLDFVSFQSNVMLQFVSYQKLPSCQLMAKAMIDFGRKSFFRRLTSLTLWLRFHINVHRAKGRIKQKIDLRINNSSSTHSIFYRVKDCEHQGV